jgi:hypothetical protein
MKEWAKNTVARTSRTGFSRLPAKLQKNTTPSFTLTHDGRVIEEFVGGCAGTTRTRRFFLPFRRYAQHF